MASRAPLLASPPLLTAHACSENKHGMAHGHDFAACSACTASCRCASARGRVCREVHTHDFLGPRMAIALCFKLPLAKYLPKRQQRRTRQAQPQLLNKFHKLIISRDKPLGLCESFTKITATRARQTSKKPDLAGHKRDSQWATWLRIAGALAGCANAQATKPQSRATGRQLGRGVGFN